MKNFMTFAGVLAMVAALGSIPISLIEMGYW